MSSPDRPVRVADVRTPDGARTPDGPGLVRIAANRGFDRVLVHAYTTAEGWLIVHPDPEVTFDGETRKIEDLSLEELRRADERPASLEQTMLAAHRVHLGLVVHLHETLGISALAAALGIMKGDDTANLRRRYLVLVSDQRIGRRLRTDARQVPSALILREEGGGWRGRLQRRLPNLARAGADCDDLVVPATLYPPERVRDDLVPLLARRAVFAWVSGLDETTETAYADTGAGGLIVACPAG